MGGIVSDFSRIITATSLFHFLYAMSTSRSADLEHVVQSVVPDVAHVLPPLHDAHVDGVAQLHVLTLIDALLAHEDFLGSNIIRRTVREWYDTSCMPHTGVPTCGAQTQNGNTWVSTLVSTLDPACIAKHNYVMHDICYSNAMAVTTRVLRQKSAAPMMPSQRCSSSTVDIADEESWSCSLNDGGTHIHVFPVCTVIKTNHPATHNARNDGGGEVASRKAAFEGLQYTHRQKKQDGEGMKPI